MGVAVGLCGAYPVSSAHSNRKNRLREHFVFAPNRNFSREQEELGPFLQKADVLLFYARDSAYYAGFFLFIENALNYERRKYFPCLYWACDFQWKRKLNHILGILHERKIIFLAAENDFFLIQENYQSFLIP